VSGFPAASTASRRIRLLDAVLANQIAAGEVVERPASVLKELLENSLDAGARRVRVEVAAGGAALVKVSDDGRGIASEDLALALERHATSKIATLDELESVASLGFRGEALPSIASVARLRIESRAAGADCAWALEAQGGGAAGPPAPTAHPPGTTVSVRDLFFNTPVRRRFLRTARTELRHLDRAFRRAALAAFPVAMSLVHDGREVLRVPAAGTPDARRRRVARLLGAAFAEEAVEVDEEAAGLRLWGWLGPAERARERSEHQHLYVNGRPVADVTVRHAVRLAYADTVPPGLQPGWVLFLELDPRVVDVNVHPTKQEVRFREARTVHDFVRSAARAALLGAAAAPPPRAQPVPAGERRAPYREVPDRPAQADPELSVVAVSGDGVAVARDGNSLRVARTAELSRAHAGRVLSVAAAGNPVTTRPLLIPERVPLGPGVALSEEGAAALEVLGFDLRAGVADGLHLLAVPEPLAGVPPGELAAGLAAAVASPPTRAGEPAAWIAALSDLAGAAPPRDAEGVGRIWLALRDAGESPGACLDAAAADTLLARRR
jgi:DNA mismatch repair protein MutL